MTAMKTGDYSSIIESAIRDNHYHRHSPEGLYTPIDYGMSAGGKRLRPSLLLMTAEAFGGAEGLHRAIHAALGYELFHNFTLLHDDVMDNSAMRRGRPSVQAKWGVDTAILSGDTMLNLAMEQVMQVPDDILRPVLELFNDMAIKVYEGQQYDMEFEKADNVSVEDYLRMISLKTGALISAAVVSGAMIGGAGKEDIERMRGYADNLGIAFQIQDDWLDVYGDALTFGKPIGGDINNGKKSYLLLTALSGGTSDAEALREAMKIPAGEGRVKAVTRIYDKMDISNRVRAEVNRYSADALQCLRQTSLGEAAREPFVRLADKLTGRTK